MSEPWAVGEWAAPRAARIHSAGRRVSEQERLDRVEFYYMTYAHAGNDGGPYADIHIAVDTTYCIAWKAWLRQAALVIGGWPISFVQGGWPQESWSLMRSSRDRWDRRGEKASHYTGKPAEALFLSDGPPIAGWPEPACLEDLQSGVALAAKVENRYPVFGFKLAGPAATAEGSLTEASA